MIYLPIISFNILYQYTRCRESEQYCDTSSVSTVNDGDDDDDVVEEEEEEEEERNDSQRRTTWKKSLREQTANVGLQPLSPITSYVFDSIHRKTTCVN